MAKRKRTLLSLRYIDELVAVSDAHVYTFVKVPTVRYEFLNPQDRMALALDFHFSLAGLVSGQTPVEGQLITTSRPFDANAWAVPLAERTHRWTPKPGWPKYLKDMSQHMDKQGFRQKEVYLAICVATRLNTGRAAAGFLAPVKRWVAAAEDALEMADYSISKKDLDAWHSRAHEVRRHLITSPLAAEPVHANTVAWLVKKMLHPEMATPPPTSAPGDRWHATELEELTEGYIANYRRHLEITQVDWDNGTEQTGYAATLAFARFPDVMHYPLQEPWIHAASALPFPVDFHSRFMLTPPARVQKDLGRKLYEVKDQAQHIAETGTGIPFEIQEQYDRAVSLEYIIKKEQQPWVYARHRLRITAPSEDELFDRVRETTEHYRAQGIDLAWPSGDQFDLLLESLPGDKPRGTAYFQRQELQLLGGGMAHADATVGDQTVDGKGWKGPYIGYTTSRVRTPVHTSIHSTINKNNPPGVAIIGQPGGGKSFLAFTMAYQMAMQGVWTIYIDPKADAAPMAKLAGLGNARTLDLANGHAGILDPFSLVSNVHEAHVMALEVIRLLLGGSMSEERESALLKALKVVAAGPEPSLGKVVEVLLASDTIEGQNLGMALDVYRELPFAQLCFSPKQGEPIRAEDGLTVIQLLGLDLPAEETEVRDYSYKNRLAVSVMFLITEYARQLMLHPNKKQPKCVFIDEAWAVTKTRQGAKLIPEFVRMGRSHNNGLVLVTQNAGDLKTQGVTNSISIVYAFVADKKGEVDDVLDLLGAEINEANRKVVRELNKGECLMRDAEGRIARVKVDAWSTELFEAFDTNPETRGKSTANEQ